MTNTYDSCTIYAGPAQISGRGDSDSSGIWVKFQLPNELGAKAHPFRGFTGKQCQIAVVLCDDNGEPQNVAVGGESTPRSSAANAEGEPHDKPRTPFKDLPKSQQAAIKCQDDDFQAWILPPAIYDKFTEQERVQAADQVLKDDLRITSKKELDTDPAAGERWSRLLTDYELKDIAK